MSKATKKGMLRTLATRSVIAVIPVAMVSAYASNMLVPTPPRLAEYSIQKVAEITDAPTTVGVADSQLYGMTTDEINQQLDQLQSIGVTNIRVLVPWALVEVAPDTYNWSVMDQVMQAAAARNMGVLADVNSTPLWMSSSYPAGAGPADPAQYADFLNAFINHEVTVGDKTVSYGSIVSAYEVWNEPNSMQFSNPIDPVAYAALVKAASAVIRAGDPTASVIIGAVGAGQDSAATMNTVTFVTQMFAALGPNAAQYFDALSIHPYSQEQPFGGSCPTCAPGLLTPREQFEAIAAMQQLTGKKIWISEYGIPTTPNGPFTEADQAAWEKNLLDTWNAYADPTSAYYDPKIAALLGPIFLYTGSDTPNAADPNDPEDYFGLFDANGNLKAAGEMLKEWLAALNPTNPTNPGNPSNPGQAIAQFIAALTQQIAHAIAQIGQAVQAVVQAITHWLGSLGTPAATAAPLMLKIASVKATTDVEKAADAADGKADAADATTDADATDAKATDTKATDTKATDDETDATKAVDVAADATATATATATPAAATTAAATPVAETPTAATPVAATPADTTAVASTPAATTPVDSTPTKTTTTTTDTSSTGTSATAPSTDKGDPSGTSGDAKGDKGQKGDKGGKDKGTKSDSSKPGGDKSGADKGNGGGNGSGNGHGNGSGRSDSSSGHQKGKGGNGSDGAGAKSKSGASVTKG